MAEAIIRPAEQADNRFAVLRLSAMCSRTNCSIRCARSSLLFAMPNGSHVGQPALNPTRNRFCACLDMRAARKGLALRSRGSAWSFTSLSVCARGRSPHGSGHRGIAACSRPVSWLLPARV